MAAGRNGSNGVTPGRAYRAYRFPHRKGGRLSRRYTSPGARVGVFAGGLTALLLGFGLFLGGSAAAVVGYFAADLPAAHALETVQIPLSTYIYDRTGQHVLFRLEDERRIPIELAAVPLRMQQATTAIEDKSFWTNPGIDIGGIIRAAQANMSSGEIVGGGSTITQQLIKSRLLGDEPTFARKIKEAILALEATRTFPKEKILEMYFNQIYYGNQAYGIRAAAYTYFGVNDLNELSLGQMAMLAGLPQLPSRYDPVQNPAGAKARRADVLEQMVQNGYITQAEADVAKEEPIVVKPASTSIYAPHFTFRVREQIINELGEKAAYRGGYRILTTLDRNMQELAEKEVRDHVDSLKGSNVNNAALITMDPRTGEILAYVGSKDYYDHSPEVQGDYDSAGIAYRQPGSTFKLFTYLAGMLKGTPQGPLTPSTILNDIEFKMPDGSGTGYAPRNAPQADGKSQQHGPITLRQALRQSLNLPALSVARMVGVEAIMDTIKQMGISRDWGDRSRYGLSFSIGAGEMRLLDMASAFQVVANNGRRVEPTMILKITDRDGKVVKDYSKPEEKQVIPEGVAYVMTDMLKDTTDPVNGSFLFGNWTTIGRPAALKTGTTDNLQDVLAIGYVPQRLTAIWMGNANNEEMRGITSAMGPGVLWRDYMKSVVGGLPVEDFKRPADVVEKVVCVNPGIMGGNGSGKLPGAKCPGNFRRTEVFVKGTEPTTNDDAFWASPGCIRLVAHFPDWQPYANAWGAAANGGAHSYGRFNWCIAGVGSTRPSGSPAASGAPAASPTAPPPGQQPPRTVAPTPTPPPRTPAPTKKP
ncbi:MAG TPA: transglycosylase domain-containing protein [Candidatus Limnocylindria bacterium]|nr:transglycosylase domain-containing protein [Candidatus Limnocylindria bacterium]